jgi:hypothetical protein
MRTLPPFSEDIKDKEAVPDASERRVCRRPEQRP